MKFKYDIIVVGGGHAGCEAAVAATKMGCETLLITMDMDKLGAMSCNPAVGGVAKGQIVREIDALGGMMGVVTDKSTVQFRMLGRSKGAAMWSPRAQCDKHLYSKTWREVVDKIPKLSVWQDDVVDIITKQKRGGETGTQGSNGGESQKLKISGVVTQMGVKFTAKAVVLTCGTFLKGLMHVGEFTAIGGRAGDKASMNLTENLEKIGFKSDRMKTGTPVRIDGRTINFSVMEPQYGDTKPSKFSFLESIPAVTNQLPCHLVYTSEKVHNTLKTGFDKSPLLTGKIKGIGPRYCPSIEDKLRTFEEKNSHQLFLEPEGKTTNEYYLNGFSSSLPLEVQVKALNQIKGLENAQIYKAGYAIEYDFFQPTQLYHTLETKLVKNLYFAGQINGTTGYEEAAAQGLIAAINAALGVKKTGKTLTLGRNEAYIGVLIDDLVTKGVDEPYRMFTSRAEYRILLRQDNADERLTPRGREIGLVDDNRWNELIARQNRRLELEKFIQKTSVAPENTKKYFEKIEQPNITQRKPIHEIIPRNNVTIMGVAEYCKELQNKIKELKIRTEDIEYIEIAIKYGGYIEREKIAAEKIQKLENHKIPENFNFESLKSISIEAKQKLTKIQPKTIGQASRIPGVSPADINTMLIYFGR